jgi:hypothetical protein
MNLSKGEDTENRKRTQQITFCGEVALEGAMGVF